MVGAIFTSRLTERLQDFLTSTAASGDDATSEALAQAHPESADKAKKANSSKKKKKGGGFKMPF